MMRVKADKNEILELLSKTTKDIEKEFCSQFLKEKDVPKKYKEKFREGTKLRKKRIKVYVLSKIINLLVVSIILFSIIYFFLYLSFLLSISITFLLAIINIVLTYKIRKLRYEKILKAIYDENINMEVYYDWK